MASKPLSEFISLADLGRWYELDQQVLATFAAEGLFTPCTREQELYIKTEDLPELESLIRLYLHLELDLDGLDIVRQMRSQIVLLQERVNQMQYQLEQNQLRQQRKWSTSLILEEEFR